MIHKVTFLFKNMKSQSLGYFPFHVHLASVYHNGINHIFYISINMKTWYNNSVNTSANFDTN